MFAVFFLAPHYRGILGVGIKKLFVN